jgi:hypothetical protein
MASLFSVPLMDRPRGFAVAVGVMTSAMVTAAIAGREYARITEIMRFMSATANARDVTNALVEQRLMYAIAIASGIFVGGALCLAFAITRPPVHPLVAGLVPFIAFIAILPQYWFVYRDAPAGWHINIAEEYRLAQPAGVLAGVIGYGLIRLMQRLVLRSRPAAAQAPHR